MSQRQSIHSQLPDKSGGKMLIDANQPNIIGNAEDQSVMHSVDLPPDSKYDFEYTFQVQGPKPDTSNFKDITDVVKQSKRNRKAPEFWHAQIMWVNIELT